MPGTANWREKCPVCKGQGKIQVWDKKSKKISYQPCPACNGSGNIIISKKILRRKT